MYFGAGKGFKNIILIAIGTGLGSGIVVDGHVLYGANDSVGEIGHMNMYRHGRACRCGSSGCLGTDKILTLFLFSFRSSNFSS